MQRVTHCGRKVVSCVLQIIKLKPVAQTIASGEMEIRFSTVIE